jgi:hypothetical protein
MLTADPSPSRIKGCPVNHTNMKHSIAFIIILHSNKATERRLPFLSCIYERKIEIEISGTVDPPHSKDSAQMQY